MKKNFSETLKELRLKAGYTQKQVYDMLGIRQSTFSAWETGRAEPSADMLLKLCKLYHVNAVFAAFGYDGYNEDGSIRLNMEETDLIEKYRDLDNYGKNLVNTVIEKESERKKAQEKEYERSIPKTEIPDLVYEEYELPNNIQKAAQTPVPYTKD